MRLGRIDKPDKIFFCAENSKQNRRLPRSVDSRSRATRRASATWWSVK
jgi:hypothetical protein